MLKASVLKSTVRTGMALLTILIVGLGSAAAAEPMTLQLKWKHAFQFAGFYMAVEKGYYQEAGLDVTLLEGGVGKDAVEHVLHHQHAYAVAGSGALLAFAQGRPIKVFGAIFQHSPLALLVKADADIHSFADLRGKRVMMRSNIEDIDVWSALKNAGLTAGDFTLQAQSFDLQDLIDGNTDAFSAYVTDQPNQLKKLKIPYRILQPKDEGIDFYGDILITSNHEILQNPERVHAMMQASMRGWVYALEHMAETVDVILKKYNSQHFSKQHLMFEAMASEKLILHDLVQVGYMNTHRWQHIAQVYAGQGLMAENVDILPFIYQPEHGLFEVIKENLWFLFFIVLFLVVAVSGGTIVMLRQKVKAKTKALQESEARYRQMVEYSPEPIVIHSKGVWVFANPASMELFGATSPEDVIGQPVMNFVHPDYRALVMSRMGGSFAEGEAQPMLEEKLLRCDGTVIWAEVTALSLMYRGQPSAMAMTRDITARKQKEEQNKLQNHKMAALQEVLRHLNMAQSVDEANQAVMDGAQQVFGSDRAAMLAVGDDGQRHFSAWLGLSPTYRAAFDDCPPWAAEDGDMKPISIADVQQHAPMEAWMLAANQQEGIQALTMFPIVGAQGLLGDFIVYYDAPHAFSEANMSLGNILANDYVATVQRIAEFKENARHIELERLKMQTILDTAPIGMWMLDKNSRILFVNHNFTALLGVSEQAFMDAAHYTDLLPEAVAQVCKDSDRRCFKGEGLVVSQEQLPCADGLMHTFDMTKSLVYNHDGEVAGLVGIAVDASKRLAMEQEKEAMQSQVEHTQRLESLGVLAGGIAHDFNNILTAIMANAAMGQRACDEDAQAAKTCMQHIVQASERAALLCKQMLDYSGKGHFVVKPMRLGALVQDIMSLLESSVHRGVSIVCELDDDLPCMDADESQLQQVVMNLIINASEAMEGDNGVIHVRTGLMDADLLMGVVEGELLAADYVYLEIEDTGCGMDEEAKAKLFEPFFTTKFTGRGLGMSAVLGIVRGHAGAIEVESELGQGTTFRLLFPVSAQADAVVEALPTVEALLPTQLGTILIVDDEEAIRMSTSMMLEDMGFSTLTAVDGFDGLAVYEAHQQDICLVLLDMTMPKLDGKGCFKALRGINAEVKVVLSSGYSEKEAMTQFDGLGVTGFIQKPYLPEKLEQSIQQVLAQA